MAWRERVHGGGGEHDQHGAGAGGQRGLRGVRAGCGGQGEHGRIMEEAGKFNLERYLNRIRA